MSEHVFDTFPGAASSLSGDSSSEGSSVEGESDVRFADEAARSRVEGHGKLAGSYAEARRLAILDFERAYVVDLLALTGGNVSQAARVAKIDRVYLHRLIRRHRPAGNTPTLQKAPPARPVRDPGARWESLKAIWLVPQPSQKKA
jgi:hypothetical protein